jgi:flavin-dependent dehydrogenase
VEVFFCPGFEIYVAPQQKNAALVSILMDESALEAFTGRTEAAFSEAIRSCPQISGRMQRAVRISEILGLGPLGGRAEKWQGPGWTLVGDCAGSVDPITGEGISLALLNGQMAAENYFSKSTAPTYESARTRLVRKQHWLERVLLSASETPWLCELLLSWLALRPSDFDRLLSACSATTIALSRPVASRDQNSTGIFFDVRL